MYDQWCYEPESDPAEQETDEHAAENALMAGTDEMLIALDAHIAHAKPGWLARNKIAMLIGHERMGHERGKRVVRHDGIYFGYTRRQCERIRAAIVTAAREDGQL